MGASTHRVRRQRWSVRTRSGEEALVVRRWMHDHCGAELKDALELAFDRMAPDDRIVRLDRLEINLHVDDVAELASLLPSRIVDAFPQQVEEPVEEDETRPVPPKAVEADDEEALREYLRSGNVAWPRRPDDEATLRALQSTVRTSAARIAGELIARDDAHVASAALVRLFQLIAEDEWPSVISAIAEVAAPTRVEILRRLDLLLSTSQAAGPRLRLVVSKLLASEPAGHSRHRSDPRLDESPGSNEGAKTEERIWSAGGRPAEVERHTVLDRAAAGYSTDDVLSDGGLVSQPDAARTDESHGAEKGFASAVAHAGVVLLHPFLPQFFRATGVDLAVAPSPASTARAAALLHFVATGREEPYEFELGLIKIFVGLAPNAPLPVAAGLLTGVDREEAHGLLQATIDHWRALRQTSIAAVRASFLQRPGLVTFDDNGWRLQIEPGPFDVLLQRLPWSTAVVKLPWMNAPLHCEWPTS